MTYEPTGSSSIREPEKIAERLAAGHALLVIGIGLDAALAQGVSARLLGTGVAIRSMMADAATVTAIANDYGFDQVYSRQVAALVREGDVLLMVSTGAPHTSLIEAAKTAYAAGATVATARGGARTAASGTCPHLDDMVDAIIARQNLASRGTSSLTV
jgi:D-sedoheptulose 7-phosphate isomerase